MAAGYTTQDFRTALLTKVHFMLADMRSYIYLRSQPGFSVGGHNLGGGNFASTMSAFALLGLLSKCYSAVVNPRYFVDADDVTAWATSKELLLNQLRAEKSAGLAKGIICPKPLLYTARENDCFYSYVVWLLESKIDLGLPDDRAVTDKVWDDIRNSLFHRFSTRSELFTFEYGSSKTGTTAESEEAIRQLISNGRKPFMLDSTRSAFLIDVLYMLLAENEAVFLAFLDLQISDESANILEYLLFETQSP